MWATLLFLPKTLLIGSIGFIFFRITDIVKPWPASYFDKRTGGWAIMLDDIIAGFYANLFLQVLLLVKWLPVNP
jgi:phosphatidylglycerophosphatase A